jgi:GR25 family glycosyltransferase involved in LPS biosynthesis
MLPEEYRGDAKKIRSMLARPQKGAIGCHFSQVSIISRALEFQKNAMVLEDDVVFCSDFIDRMNIFNDFLKDKPWDVIWLGGTYHTEPTWHAAKHSPDLKGLCKCKLNRDWEPTENPHIVRTYGAWSTYAYIVNVNSIERILSLLDHYLPESIGIDWLFILLQPELITYAFNPGTTKQMDNKSNIGDGMTIFSNFHKLGAHWFQDKM